MLMWKKTPIDKIIRATFITYHENKYQISAINNIKITQKILKIIH
jgi:hypothetical protein